MFARSNHYRNILVACCLCQQACSDGSDRQLGAGGTATSTETSPEDTKPLPGCDTSTLLDLTQTLTFPARNGCDWSLNGNLAAKDAYYQARESQIQNLSMPAGAVICQMTVSAAASNFRFDDHLVVTINDQVLFASTIQMKTLLQASNGVLTWDWERLKGKAHDDDLTKPYCLDASTTNCSMPLTQDIGQLSVSLSDSSLQKLPASVRTSSQLSFAAIVTGDDDPIDCSYGEFTLDIQIKYPGT